MQCAEKKRVMLLRVKSIDFFIQEERKKFDKLTAKFYQSQERNLNLKTKNSNTDAVKEVSSQFITDGSLTVTKDKKTRHNRVAVLQDDNELVLKRGAFYRASMQYVLLLQEVQERKKFEFVETVSIAAVRTFTGCFSSRIVQFVRLH